MHLLRRELPEARQGKGDALNAAIAHLETSGLVSARSPHEVVVAVFDADGRIAPEALGAVAGYFRDPKVAWVQTPQWSFDVPEGDDVHLERVDDDEQADDLIALVDLGHRTSVGPHSGAAPPSGSAPW